MIEHDHTQSLEIASHLRNATQKLHDIARDVGAARTVVKFSTTRRDNLIAKYSEPFLKEGQSAAKAELQARVKADFHTELETLIKLDETAEITIATNDALEKVYDANRSLLSYSKTFRGDLQG